MVLGVAYLSDSPGRCVSVVFSLDLNGLTPPYRTIVADPPWRRPNSAAFSQAPQIEPDEVGPYASMAVEDIAAIDVRSFYAKVASLFLWVPARHLEWGNEVAKAWGFVPLCVLNCIATDSQAKRSGILPESVMVCRSEASADYSLAEIGKTRYRWQDGASRPDEFYELVKAKSVGPYLELFPRSWHKGWDFCGGGPKVVEEQLIIDVTDAKAESTGSTL